jgi:hypothetical protein
MKVSKPPSGLVSGHAVGPSATKSASAKGFADKLAKASAGDKARAAAAPRPAARAGGTAGVADIASELKAGKITPQAALHRVVERIVTRQVGKKGPAALREKLAATLRQTLEDDPLLAAKVRTLEGL